MLEIYKNIKSRRLELNLTQTELAHLLGYADKSMIAKIEKGLVDLPQSKIVAFAKVLKTTPGELMGINTCNNEDIRDAFFDMVISQVYGEKSNITTDDTHMNRIVGILSSFETLNVVGQLEALKRVEELTHISKYVDKKTTASVVKYNFYEKQLEAAHERTDIAVTADMRKHDNDIMDDENF